MVEYKPDLAYKGSVWVCSCCGRYNKSRSKLHVECNCAPTPGGYDLLAESSSLVKNEHDRVIDFSQWFDWKVQR